MEMAPVKEASGSVNHNSLLNALSRDSRDCPLALAGPCRSTRHQREYSRRLSTHQRGHPCAPWTSTAKGFESPLADTRTLRGNPSSRQRVRAGRRHEPLGHPVVDVMEPVVEWAFIELDG